MKSIFFSIVVIGLLNTGCCLAATYYVSPAGNDSNNGTSTSTPWQSIAKVNASSFSAGDSILFQGGQVFSGSLQFTSLSKGTSVEPITVNSYGTGLATISATGNGIELYDTAGFVLENLIINGGSHSTNTGRGIYLANDLSGNVVLTSVTITNVTVSNFGFEGLAIYGLNGSSGWGTVTITDSTFSANQDGIQTFAMAEYAIQNITITECALHDNPGVSGASNPTGDGIVLGDVDGATVEFCEAYGNGANNTNPAGPVGIWCYNSNDVLLAADESYNNHCGTGADGDGFDFDLATTNSTMEYNYSHGNVGAGFLMCNSGASASYGGNVIRYNISENDGLQGNGYGAITAFGNINETDVYNNTVYVASPASGGITLTGGTASGLTFRNNIVYLNSSNLPIVSASYAQAASGVVFQGNNYWRTDGQFLVAWGNSNYTSLTNWRATGQEKNGAASTGFNVDPQLTSPGAGGTIGDADNFNIMSAYNLEAGSPMIDAALNLATLFATDPGSTDFSGLSIPQGSGYDIGACEYAPGQLPSSWSHADIGTPGIAGGSSYGNGTFTLHGSGTDIFGSGDGFQYAYQKASGDCSMTARVVSQTNTDVWAKAGVMIRATLAADSPHLSMEATPGHGMHIDYETAIGSGEGHIVGISASLPYWVRITRAGNVITGYESADGATWTEVDSATIPMATSVYIGLDQCSHNNTKLGASTFDNVTVTP